MAVMLVACAWLALPAAHPAAAQSGSWAVNSSGFWTTSGNWSGGVIADGSGNTANFTTNISANRIVTLGANRLIGNLVFSDGGGAGFAWTIASGGGEALTINGGGYTITATTDATISAPIDAPNGFDKNGAGTLTISGTSGNTGSGGSIFSGGAVILNKSSGVAINGAIQVNNSTLTANAANQIGNTATLLLNPGSTYNYDTDTFTSLTLNAASTAARVGTSAPTLTLTGAGNGLTLGVDSFGSFQNSGTFNVNLGSAVNVTNQTYLASFGRLFVNDGHVTTGSLKVQNTSGFSSLTQIKVDGGNARLTVNGTTDLGTSIDDTTTTVQNGGRVNTSTSASVLMDAGTLTVTGAGSRWDGGTFQLANRTASSDGAPVMTVSAGGVVTTTNISMGETMSFTHGTMTVTGAGSQILATGSVTLGLAGNGPFGRGTLNALNQGLFNTSSFIRLSSRTGAANDPSYSSFLVLNNGIVACSSLSVESGAYVQGYGVLMGTVNVLSGAHYQIDTPTGAVNLSSVGLSVGSRYARVYSNAIPQFGGAVTLAGGTIDTTPGSSVEGFQLTGSGSLSGFGTLIAGAGGLSGVTTSSLVASGGTLTVDQSGSSTFLGTVNGSGSLAKQGTGTLTLGGTAANTNTGTTVVNAGTLAFAKNTGVNAVGGDLTLNGGIARLLNGEQMPNSATLTMNGGTFDLNGNGETVGTLAGSGGTIALGSGTLAVNPSGTSTYGGTIGGSGNLIKVGTGTLTLAGGAAANTFTGLTTVSAGTLELAKNTSVNAVGGDLTVNGGTVRLLNGEQIPAALTVNGGTFDLNGNGETVSTLAGGGCTIAFGGGTLAVNQAANTNFDGSLTGAAASALVKTGGGRLHLNGDNSAFQGTIGVQGGSLQATHANALGGASGPVTVSAGASLELFGAIAVGAKDVRLNGAGVAGSGALRGMGGGPSLAGPVTLQTDSTVQVNAGTLALSGPIGGPGRLTKTGPGPLTLSGNGAYAGGTQVDAGRLVADHNSALGGGAVTVNDTGTLEVAANRTVANAVTVNSGGSLVVNGTYTGSLTFNPGASLGGSGTLGGGLASAGTVAPGNSAGTLAVTGNYAQTAAGSLVVELGGTAAGTLYDVLNVGGSATLDGTLDVRLINGFVPTSGQTFTVMNYTSRSGDFSTFLGTSLPNGMFLVPTPGSTSYSLTVSPVPEPEAVLALCAIGGLVGAWARRLRRKEKSAAASHVRYCPGVATC